jgi:hypothetical protein
MSKALASIQRGLRQAIRHQRGKRVTGVTVHVPVQTRALLEILALGERQVEVGKTVSAAKAFRRLRARRARRSGL